MILLVKRYTVEEAARRLNRNLALVYRWLAEGRLRGEKWGRSWLIRDRDLQRFLRNAPERRKSGASAIKEDADA